MNETENKMLDIDGSVLEGGGQILRIAVALSALLRKPIRVRNIRAGRSKPGLRAQHLAGLRLVQEICQAKLEGGDLGSTEIKFIPQKINAGNFVAETGTAGSVVLLLQIALPCLIFANGPCQLILKGGTNADMAPQIDYTLMVFKPLIEKLGAKFDCKIIRRGYFPKGGGIVEITSHPVAETLGNVIMTEKGDVNNISGRSYVAGVLPFKLAHLMADSGTKIIRPHFPGIKMNVERLKEPESSAVGTSNGIVIVAETSSGCIFAGSALGKRGVQAEVVGKTAAEELCQELKHGGCVDLYSQDQLIIFMALAKGTSRLHCGPLTMHTKTAIHITELLTDATFHLKEEPNNCLIECSGVGLSRS